MALPKRPVDGVLLLDKPTGITSNKILQKIKALFLAQKAGHTGSLDPLATGMLPICFGQATKFSQYLLNADKVYQVTAKLGETTDTLDSDGEVVTRSEVPALTDAKLESILQSFRGDIQQVPPMYSALKHQGQPLYKLARKGLSIDRPERPVTINQLTLDNLSTDTFSLTVDCSKGTYIRTLVADIGEVIGCGAHVTTLRRLTVAGFDQPMVGFAELEKLTDVRSLDKYLLPVSVMLQGFEALVLTDSQILTLKFGQRVDYQASDYQGVVQLLSEQGDFVGLGELLADHSLCAKRMMQ